MFLVKKRFLKTLICFLVIFQCGLVSAIPAAFAATNIGTDVTTDGDVKAGDGSFILLGSQPDPDPAGVNGAIYYNTTNSKFRCYENSSWKDCIASAASVVLSSIGSAIVANTINNGDFAQIWNWSLTTADQIGLNISENLASTAGGDPRLLGISTLVGSTAQPLHIENFGNNNSISVDDEPGDTTPFVVTETGQVGVGTSTFNVANTEKLKVESEPGSQRISGFYGDINAPQYISIQNRNSGINASSAISSVSDDGTTFSNYITTGIASSGFADPLYSIAGPHDAYIFNVADFSGTGGGNLVIGTAEPNKSIKFATGGGLDASNERLRIDSLGNVGIGTTTPGSKLDVNGEIRFSNAASDYVGFTAPAAVTTSTTYTLPVDDGTGGQALVTDGSGNLSWASATSVWQRIGTVLSPLIAGDDITTTGNISATGTGTVTSAGLLTGSGGADISGADVEINKDSNFNTYINTGTSTGTVNIGSSLAGAVVIESASTVTLQGGANTITSPTGEIKFQAADSATTGVVKVGDGGAGSTTPDILALDVKSDAGDPVLGSNGSMYYNANTNKFRCYVNGSWSNCASAALDTTSAAVAANTINNGDNAQRWNWSLTTANKKGFTFGENVASTASGAPVILTASTLASSTAMPLFVENLGNGNSFRVDDSSGDTTPFLIDENGNVAIGSNSFDPVNPERLKVESGPTSSSSVISAYGDIDAPLYIEVRDRNSGTSAASVFAATADDGDTGTNYAAMGIASSGFSDPTYGIAVPHDAFLFNVGDFTGTQGGNMIIGTVEPGMSIKFITGGGAAATNEQMRIDENGYVGINTTTPGSELDVNGEIRFSNAASDYVGFAAPAAVTTSTTYTLPADDGSSGDALVTDGSGNLSWMGALPPLKRVGTTISPVNDGDDITTSGNLYTTGTGTITSAGLLTGNAGAEISGAVTNINNNSNFNTTINNGTSTGSVTIGNSSAGTIDLTSGAALTLNGGATSGFSTTAGDIALRPAGTTTTAYVKIGDGGAGSATPDLLALDVKSDAGDPAGTNGAMYYNANANKFRCYVNGSWSDCDTTGGTASLQSAYNNGPGITTAGAADIAFTLTSGNFTATGAGAVNLTPTSASSFNSGGALTLTGGAASTWSTSSGALTITSAAATTWGTGAGDLTLQAAGSGTTASVKIGAGGAGSTTPDLFSVDVKSTTGDPAGGYNGAMYYNEFDNLFRCYEAGGWKNCGSSAASATTLEQAYTAGPTITTSGADVALILTSGNFTASGAGSVDLTPTSASSFTSGGALTLTGGAASSWTTTAGALTIDAGTTTPDALNLGTTNATAVNIGNAGAATINAGSFQTGNDSNTGSLKIADGSSNYITLISPAIAADYTLTLPADDGTPNQFLSTNGSGILSWTNPVNPMTTEGDMAYYTAGAPARLPIGISGTVLKSDGTDPAWTALTSSDVGLGNVTNDAQISKSIGTAKGDLIAYTASNSPVRLPVGANGQYLVVDSGQATGVKWSSLTIGNDSLDFAQLIDTMTVDANTSIDLAGFNFTINDLTGGGALGISTNAAALTLTAGAASTWSTSSGALTIDSAAGLNLGTTNATGITIGSAGVATTNIGSFQTGNGANTGSLKIADGSTNYITLTSPPIATDYTLTLPINTGTNGQALTTNGSGTLSWSTIFTDPMTTRGDLVYRDATNTTTRLGRGTAGQVLKSDGTDISWQTLTNSDVGLGNVTNTAQIAKSIGTAKGDLIGYSASNTPARVPLGALNGYVLTQDSASAAGVKWAAPSVIDDSLDFAQFSDSMTLDASTSINLAGQNLTINDATGGGALKLGTVDTTGTLFVLDTKTTAGDPTGTNGAMYYNSNSNTRRCYDNGAWKNCDANVANYLFAYDTTDQTVLSTGAFQTITFTNPSAVASGWTYSAGNFTAPAAGLYLVQYNAEVGRDNNGDSTVTIRATKNAAEISGSAAFSSPSKGNRPVRLMNSFMVNLSASDLLQLQLTADGTGHSVGLFSNNDYGTTKPRITLTITKLT